VGRNDFIFDDRGSGQTTVLLPGWATDYRIFDDLALQTDWIRARDYAVVQGAGFGVSLASIVRDIGCPAVTLLGWSLGGFAALDFAARHPGLVGGLVLVGIRCRFPAPETELVRRELLEDRRSCLTAFYRRCFLPPQRDEFRRFRGVLMPRYLEQMTTVDLLKGLDYLAAAAITAANLPPCKLLVVHGRQDAIAPVSEAKAIASQADNARLVVLRDAGHVAFLATDFAPVVADWKEAVR